MSPRARTHRVVQAVVLGAMVAATFAPSVLAFYRCEMMGASMSAPCCDDDAGQSATPTPQLFSARCCSKVVVSVERAPSGVTTAASDPVAPPASASLELPQAFVVSAGFPPARTRSAFDAGPPILRQTCALLI